MIKRFFLLSSLCMFLGLSAQKTHTVVKGDNPYNVSKKYGLTINELLELNPKFKDGILHIGDVLTVRKEIKTASAKSSFNETSQKLGKIVLQPKQTIYGLTKQYKISEIELRKLNPDLESHMKIGEEITLPLANIKKYADSNTVIPISATSKAAHAISPQVTASPLTLCLTTP